MERIVLERTTPVQGEAVGVTVYSKGKVSGTFGLDFYEWLHFSKLLKAGQEYQKGRDEQRVEVVIVGKGQQPPTVKAKEEDKVQQPVKRTVKREVTDDEVAKYLEDDYGSND